MFTIGCGSSDSELTAINNSGKRLENVAISAGEKSFTFGVLIDGGKAGYMTADQTFGRLFPDVMTMRFEDVDGKTFEREIEFKNKRTRRLIVTIDSELNATGMFE